MNQHKFSFRITALAVAIALMLGVFAVRLYQVQVVQGAEQAETPSGTFTYRTRVTAARGEILDRNGTVLIGNRAAFNVLLFRDVVFNADTPNENLRRLTNLAVERGLEFNDHLPVTAQKPYEYTTSQSSTRWNEYFRAFLAYREWDSDISAPRLIQRLRERYHIPDDWSEEEARRVISVRYELDLRVCTNLPTYVFLEDLDAVSLAALSELNVPGVRVTATTVREYHTDYAAHILGVTGDMNPDEYEYYKQYDYAMDAEVGKEGLEKAFELELHGTDGILETTVSPEGVILSERYITPPVAGNNVELTIDLDIQKTAEDNLEKIILDLRENGIYGRETGKDAEGGAIVVMSPSTGEVLACASYPTYKLSSYYEDFQKINEQEYGPLFNRATMMAKPPGSIFKMVTTIAAINSGAISQGTTITDQGIYSRFSDVGYSPRCMLWTTAKATHGTIDVMDALAVSCNYFFYEAGWLTGISEIDRTAKALGLGEPTGIELPEATGHRANPEVKAELYDGDYSAWYGGDTVSAAIGQSEHLYTPMQLCCYVSALANRGVRYKATFLRRVLSSDYQSLVRENRPTILSTLKISDAAYAAYTEGMRRVTSAYNGSSYGTYGNYEIPTRAKTGTAEHGSGGSDNASYVLYAPADKPEIAIAIYVEKGGNGSFLGRTAKSILDVYFSGATTTDTVPGENTLN